MAAPTEFTLESVKDFIIEKGGRVTNHELVKHFKLFLTDPATKGKILIELQCHRQVLTLAPLPMFGFNGACRPGKKTFIF